MRFERGMLSMSNISDKNLQFITEWKETLPDYAKDFITLKSKTSAISTIRIYVNNIKIFSGHVFKYSIEKRSYCAKFCFFISFYN